MRAIFCGNFEYDARQSELERLFRKYGKVDRVDMKSGFAFIYMEDERDAEDAIRALDRIEFGRKGRRLRVEWTNQERGGSRRSGSSRRSSSNLRPSKTLFVINFDPHQTRTRDLERHFEPYGKIVSVRIRRNFAFVQYECQEDAAKALDATNMSKLMDRVISVEYTVRDDDERSVHGSDRDRNRSPERTRRSPSPYQRKRGSPDYGRGGTSPYQRERGSPDYGRGGSPVTHQRERTSPDYGRGPSQSPHRRKRSRSNSYRGRSRSQSRSRSPYGERRASPENGHVPSSSPYKRHKDSRERSRSPYRRERDSRDHSCSPYDRKNKRVHSDNCQVSPQTPEEGERLSPENSHEHLPKSSSVPRDSPPNYGHAESPANGWDNSVSPSQED